LVLLYGGDGPFFMVFTECGRYVLYVHNVGFAFLSQTDNEKLMVLLREPMSMLLCDPVVF